MHQWTIDEIKEANEAGGNYFFSPDTMKFFSSRVLDQVYQGAGGVYFITSERDRHRTGGAPRLYTVRRFHPESGDVTTVGGFNKMDKREAQSAAAALAKGE